MEGAFADGGVLLAPLRQVSAWTDIGFAGETLYAVENPAVFEELVDHLIRSGRPPSSTPPLLCTSGWLSVAAIRVLDLAVAQGARIAYGGDFDRKGLGIAAWLLDRYGERMSLWGMGPREYLEAARHPLAENLSKEDLLRLNDYRDTPLADLAGVMQKERKLAYQEAILPLLKDMLRAGV